MLILSVTPRLKCWEKIMEDLIRVGALVVITILSIQMGLFFNWAFLALIFKAMNRIRPNGSGSKGSS